MMALGADLSLDHVGLPDRGGVAHARVLERRVRADLAALGHARRAEQAHAGADRGVLADRHVRLDARRRRLQKGHARAGVSLEDAALGALLDLHQPRPVVHPERNGGIVRGVCRDHPPAAHQGRQGAGEIELAVGQADLVERREERRRIEGVGAEVDLADREHRAREALRSLGLDDLLEASIAVAHDAAVAGGVELIGREQRRGGSVGVLRRAQTGDLLRGDERMVTRENHERPALDRAARREHGRGRSLALVLLDGLDPVGKHVGHALARPDDAQHALGARLPRGVGDPLDHRLAADAVQHLRRVRVHSRAMAGGHDQDREGLGHGLVSVATASGSAAATLRPDFGGSSSWQDTGFWSRERGFESLPPVRRSQRSLCPRGTRPASVPLSWVGPPGADDAEHAHRLEAEREALAAVGRGHVERGQLLHALEPVADRVAVGEEALGGPRDVAVGVEERLERADQLGLVLLVVARRAARPSRRRSRAARPGPRSSRAAAGGRRRSPRRRAPRGRAPRRRWRRAAPRRRRGGGRPDRSCGASARP